MSISQQSIRGKFVVLEGSDGVGKTTQLQLLQRYLETKGLEVVVVREPGGTAVGEGIRDLFKNNFGLTDPVAEVLMLLAARQQLSVEIIQPALAKGAWVLSDRHTPSTFAYQGAGHGLGFQRVCELREPLLRYPGHVADLTMILEVSAEARLVRLLARGELDRVDLAGEKFKNQVTNAYDEMLHGNWELNLGRLVGIDGSDHPEVVHRRVVNAVEHAWNENIYFDTLKATP